MTPPNVTLDAVLYNQSLNLKSLNYKQHMVHPKSGESERVARTDMVLCSLENSGHCDHFGTTFGVVEAVPQDFIPSSKVS